MQDAEIEWLKASVSCAALLERLAPGWRLDRAESTRRSLKYRRGAGEILIVTHDGRGWWDPLSGRKGDIFSLVQHLDPGLNFGAARRVLRGFAGVAPGVPDSFRALRTGASPIPVADHWERRRPLARGSPAWRYLTDARRLPPAILAAASQADAVREGPHGSAWFAHRDESGSVSHIEIRGPEFKGAVRGGRKTLFRLAGGRQPTRLAVTEAPIDALSLAALEELRADTLYAATGGGMGPGTLQALARALSAIAGVRDAVLHSATDANAAGERYAACHAELAAAAGVAFARLTPTAGSDWNDVLKQQTLA